MDLSLSVLAISFYLTYFEVLVLSYTYLELLYPFYGDYEIILFILGNISFPKIYFENNITTLDFSSFAVS